VNLTLLGATGPTGQQILLQALEAGHRVAVLVRNPARLPQRGDERIIVVTGDATRSGDVRRALAGSRALLSALGPGRNLRSDIASRAASAMMPAARDAGISRIIVLSALGVGDSMRHASRLQSTAMKLMLRRVLADKAVADDNLRASGLDWTLVYPVLLTNGPHTGRCSALRNPVGRIGGRISRADVADFMLRQVDSAEWSRATAVLTSS
jgi:putative NADH-flavin reductase